MKTKVAIHGKPFDLKDKPQLERFFLKLKECDFQPILSKVFLQICVDMDVEDIKSVDTYKENDDLKDVKFAFSFGGDGTLLELLTHVGDSEIPIVGVNMGRLGFLATTPLADIERAIDDLCNKAFEIDERILLKLESNQDVFGDRNFALNDFAILKRDSSSMIKVRVLLDGVYLNTYWADGLIISTPTGSTGYSLSCGGPLVLPQSNNFVITPVSPHNLNARPLVVSDHSEISFEIEARSDNVLISLDSRSMPVAAGIQLKIKKFNKAGKLIKFKNYNQFDTMRNKLNWGVDYRN